jgi:tetratricopeptide (TPR) repeat protein
MDSIGRFYMKTVVGVCAVVLAFCTVSACIATKQSYVSKGNKLYDAGKYADAALNYRKAIQKDPGYGEAYYRLGLAAIKQSESKEGQAREGQAREAYDALLRAVQLLPDNVAVLEKFGDVCLSYYLADPTHPQFLYRQIAQTSQELLSKNPNSYQGLVLEAYLASTDRKTKDAIALYRRALQINSSDPGVRTSLAESLFLDGQSQEAEKLALAMINGERTSYGQVYDLMYDVYTQANRAADAENILKTKVSNNPKRADWIMQLARHYNRVKKPAEIKATLQRLLDNPNDFPEARLSIGDFYTSLHDYPEAIHYFEEGARVQPAGKERALYQNRTLLLLLAQGKTDDASRLVDRILAENPQDDEARRVRADLWLDSNKAEHLDKALGAFKDLATRHPNDPVLRFHLGRAYRRKGDLESARTEFLAAIRIRKNFLEPRYELVDLDLSERPQEARKLADEILAIRPDDRIGRLLHARVLMAAGEGSNAHTELSQLIKDTPKDPDAQLQLGLLAIEQKKYAEAIDILNKLRATGEPRAYLGLAIAYVSQRPQRQLDKAVDVLNEGLKKWPDAGPLLDQAAMIEAVSGQYDLAITRYKKLISLNPKSALARRRLGEVYDLKGDRTNAVAFYQQAYDLAPNDVTLAITLADALARAGRTNEAKVKYQGIVKAHPDNASAMNNLAYLLADSGGDLDEALRLAQTALSKTPKEPGYSDTLGYIYLKKGQNSSAVQTFGNLVHSYPRFVPFRYHLGLALYEKGDKAGSKKVLNDALALHPSADDEKRINELLHKLG